MRMDTMKYIYPPQVWLPSYSSFSLLLCLSCLILRFYCTPRALLILRPFLLYFSKALIFLSLPPCKRRKKNLIPTEKTSGQCPFSC